MQVPSSLSLPEQCLHAWRVHHRQLVRLLQHINPYALGHQLGPQGDTIGELFASIHAERLPWIQVAKPDLLPNLIKISKAQTLNPYFLKEQLVLSAMAIAQILQIHAEGGKLKGIHLPPVAFTASLVSQESRYVGQVLSIMAEKEQASAHEIARELFRWPPYRPNEQTSFT